mmetsp:Transcript_7903/g.22803  ORF Transcript_7903/g.22803 Transcript_7903/m.22803 type:complete len:506 (-) Transcript_7903:17-1534(-)
MNSNESILVLYRIANSESDSGDPLFNCFRMPFGNGPTLAAVKQYCAAAHSLSHLGPEGYHWRVLVEDKAGSTGAERTYSWWDVQDSKAKLPVKRTTQYDLRKLLFPPTKSVSTTDTAAKAAKGAFKMMGKAVAAVSGEDTGSTDTGPPVSVLTFKLLDLVRINDDFNLKHGGGSVVPPTTPTSSHRSTTPRAPAVTPQQHVRTPAPPRATPAPRQPPAHQQQQQQYQQPRPTPARPPQQRHVQQQQRPAAQQQEASLMDFGDSPAPAAANANRVLHHATSSPAAFGAAVGAPKPNESRVEKLKREYTTKKTTANRVWDDVDQRWVEVKKGASLGSASAPPGASNSIAKKKETGISLDPTNAVGKSSNVQAAVNKRYNDMKEEQDKALKELREREAAKKLAEDEEDLARKQLEPKIKAWSEEHGKKKQLRALLASLHTVLWPGAKWKQISIGDVLNDNKVKRFYLKATLVVHPDKTGHLPADQRFLAKRIFDALTQAKTQFDDGAK